MRRSTLLGMSSALVLALIGGLGWTRVAPRDVPLMVNAATRFLASLTPEQRAKATFAFDSEERTHFHFVPTEVFPRNGLQIREMTEAQKATAHQLLAASLSQRGYMTAREIMEAEGILRMLEGDDRQFGRDPEQYYLSVFGTPSNAGTWGWRWEGHHISLHFTIVNGNVTVSAPTFVSANPAEVPEGTRRGMRPLARQEDAGRALLSSLTPEQRSVAIVNDVAPRDIVTGVALPAEPLSPVGIEASALNGPQRDLLRDVIEAWAGLMSPDIAELRMSKIRQGGLENIAFAWAGGTKRGEVSYFRVQGPSFLIEFDNTANDPNHIHTAWRDFDGDFGLDLIRAHVAEDHQGD
jgi:hypothetical protein